MLKDEALAQQILEVVKTLQEAVPELYQLAANRNYTKFNALSNDFNALLFTLEKTITPFEKDSPIFSDIRKGLIQNTAVSFQRIQGFFKTRSERLFTKLEFELLPLLDELYLYLYYACLIQDDPQKLSEFNKNEWKILRSNRYIEEAKNTGEYKYLVSILVIAYNQLDYTKMCIEAILKHTPPDLNYELILLNHGSNDGTREYFESIGCTKQIDLAFNGIGRVMGLRTVEGKYMCGISNDIVVGPHYLENMLKCMESDSSIMWVVPTTPNVSNLQTIPCSYQNMQEMEKFAKENNVCDPYRWEQRVRLCNPIVLSRTKDMLSSTGIGGIPLYLQQYGFGDDITSLLIRRAGGKCMLAKDAFCHHFGSVTLKHETDYMTQQHIMNNRIKIAEAYGIDPWGNGFCFDPVLFSILPCDKQGDVLILGINCGLGSDPLKVRESIKEQVRNLQVTIDNITTQYNVLEDLKSVSDNAIYLPPTASLFANFPHSGYDYIIVEENIPSIQKIKELEKLKRHLKPEGFLAIRNSNLPAAFLEDCLLQKEDWHIWKKDLTKQSQ